jgi:hypothetical protein
MYVCRETALTVDLMKSHPSDHHAWSHFESPFAVLKEAKDAIVATTAPSSSTYPDVEPYPATSEATPLLGQARESGSRAMGLLSKIWGSISGFLNPPMIGGFAAVIAGVIPFLHRWLFDTDAVLSP